MRTIWIQKLEWMTAMMKIKTRICIYVLGYVCRHGHGFLCLKDLNQGYLFSITMHEANS